MNKQTILIVDDEYDIRQQLAGLLMDEGYLTMEAASSAEALEQFAIKRPDMAILDVWLDDKEFDGVALLQKLKAQDSKLPVLMMSGHSTISTAVDALRFGAFDFLEKPFQTDKMLQGIKNALEKARLEKENQELKIFFPKEKKLHGESTKIRNIRQLLEKVSPTNSRVLITGEAGTGKEVAARMIHELSPRRNRQFYILHCATLNPDNFEQELFGLETAGSTAGANIGILEQSDGGTLLLDEIADMPFETQGKMVRVLQEQVFYRVGSRQPRPIDVRVLASSNRDLEALMAEGRLRQDLYYRLNVVPMHMPSLSDIPDDVPFLAMYFMEKSCREAGVPRKRFSDSVLSTLQTHTWPGNVRQLRNAIEWIMIMHAKDNQEVVGMEHLPPDLATMSGSAEDNGSYRISADFMMLQLKDARETFERDYLSAQLRRFKGNISRTAECIGMERSALHRKLRTLGLHTSDRGSDAPSVQEGIQEEADFAGASEGLDGDGSATWKMAG